MICYSFECKFGRSNLNGSETHYWALLSLLGLTIETVFAQILDSRAGPFASIVSSEGVSGAMKALWVWSWTSERIMRAEYIFWIIFYIWVFTWNSHFNAEWRARQCYQQNPMVPLGDLEIPADPIFGSKGMCISGRSAEPKQESNQCGSQQNGVLHNQATGTGNLSH